MPPVKASPKELWDLIAYLGMRTGVGVGAAKSQPSKAPGIDFARVSNPKPGEWLTYNGNLSGNRYSELNQINKTNVHQLTLKWIFSVPLWKNLLPDTNYFVENMRYFGLETTPIVADGVMYVTGPNAAFALDPLTGGRFGNTRARVLAASWETQLWAPTVAWLSSLIRCSW